MARELEHVVSVAGLGGVRPQGLGEVFLGAEMLAITVAADHVGAFVDDRVPEEPRRAAERGVAGQFKLAGHADEFGNLSVGMEASELVLVRRRGIENAVMIEAQGGFEIFGVSRHRVQFGQRFIHAAVFFAEHDLHLLVGKPGVAGFDPVTEFSGHCQRLGVAGIFIHIEQAGENFVQGIIRRPNRTGLLHPVNEGFREGAEVTVGEPGLACGEAGDDRVAFVLELTVTGAGVHEGAGAEIMADKMPAQFAMGFFPAAERLGGGGQSGVDAEIVQQAVHVQREQVGAIQITGMLEGAVQQLHVAQRKGVELQRHHGLNLLGRIIGQRIGTDRRRQSEQRQSQGGK